MKTIEEKARAYDEALKVLHKYDGANIMFSQSLKEEMFPELRESEDEKIRKAISDILLIDSDEIREILDANNVLMQDVDTWLKKQCEQNPANKIEPKFHEGDKIHCKLDDRTFVIKEVDLKNGVYLYTENGYGNDIGYADEMFELVKQKPADEVEPKFKVGNWYQCTKDFFGKGVTFDKNTAYYCTKEGCLQNEYGCHIAIVKDLYDNFKLWTIQDSKDGDILSDGTTIFIFKDLLSDGSVMSYCDYDTDSGESDAFCPLSMNLMCSKITPADKEQRDTLFAKIKEAGYEFDFEKNELKKINSPVLSNSSNIGKNVPAEWSREDEQNLNVALGYIDDEYLRRWLKDAIYNKYEKRWKPSEEQMSALQRCVEYLDESDNEDYGIIESLYQDLKKLREE